MDASSAATYPRDLRVLIVAEHASAQFGGEAFLPLHYFRLLRARGVQVSLLCHSRVEREIRDAFPEDGERLFFVPDLASQKALWKLSEKLPARIGKVSLFAASQLLTKRMQRRVVERLVVEQRIDVVHETTPVSPKLPSTLVDVGAPVIIGPMNGGMDYPPAFDHMRGPAAGLELRATRYMADTMNRLWPGKRKATLLLVANRRTRDALPACVSHVPTIELAENGVDLNRWALPAQRKTGRAGSLRLAFVGRLIDWKVVDVLLEALTAVDPKLDVTLEIVGDGEEGANLKALAARLGLAERVRFHGYRPQPEVVQILSECDALVLPSVFECGGAVVLEAMAMALPVIAAAWGGPADYLDDSCGIRVAPTTRPSYLDGLRRAIEDLAMSPERRRALGEAGRRKVVEAYDWERKIDRILEIYAGVVSRARLGAQAASVS